MNSNPKVSVVMICFNHERYISEAINSILSQTYNDFELIIVDDGSSDNTLNIIKGYKDGRIIVVEQENSGPSIALNTGINLSLGQYIAFMSGDDVSFPNRLETQIEQIESQKADMIFCRPQIIGPNSNLVNNNLCSWFFHTEFQNTAELYRQLFYSGNFLCAPSCFCRRTAIEKVGQFKRGLIQLQDFDYWIRACKKNLVIMLHWEPLIQYRYLYGENLSDRRNINRSEVEALAIYRSFFDKAPIDLLHKSFGKKVTLGASADCPDIEIDKSFLFLEHSTPTVKTIGIERIILQFDNDEIYEKIRTERGMDTARFFRLTKSTSIGVINFAGKLKKRIILIIYLLVRYLRLSFTEGPRWTEAQVKQRIQFYLEQGDDKRAIMVAHYYQSFPPGPTIFATMLKVLNRIFVKTIFATMIKVFNIISRKIRTIINIIRTIHLPPPILEGVFGLSRMYDYSKQNNCIIFEEPPEQLILKRPKVLGSFASTLNEGAIFTPRVYVSIIHRAVISGGSALVISQTGDLLSDEMIDFPTEDFGIKSPNISFRYKNKVILTYRKKSNTRIKEGILLSCDHDNNYFHWLVECLPKLLLIDDLKKFKDIPLLIPIGLHKNLIEALNRVNINDHPIINLDCGVAYHVERLIFPSGPSRVVDRYNGPPVFDTDIVLSQKWVSRVATLLKKDLQNKKKPWRKIYLARNKGLRSIRNQHEIEMMLSENNFEIVELDDVSLDFQIELFSQAAVIVAPTGAALTNMLLCQPGTKVIIFMSNHETTNYYFWSNLGYIAKLDVKIIAGERLFKMTNYWSVHDDYVIDSNILREEIKKHE
jgi:glycosyltransferase involved in cell wall biosynthesis